MDALFSFSGACFISAIALVWVSLRLPPALGRFKPVPLLLGLFLCYNAAPFLTVLWLPELTEELLRSTFDFYKSDNLILIGLEVLACTAAGVMGQWAATPGRARRRKLRPLVAAAASASSPTGRTLLPRAFWAIAVVSAGLLWQLRGALFSGYHDGFTDNEGELLLRGTLSSLFSLVFITYLFLWYSGDPVAFPKRRTNRHFWASSAVTAAVGLCLMSMGGRLYIASAAITLICLRLAMAPPGSTGGGWKSVLKVVSLVLVAASVGLWRAQNDFTAAAVFANALAEPLYVSISLASLFASNPLPVLQFPSFLLGDAVGLLPSSLYPDKLDRFFAISQAYAIESPVGGLNGLASLIVNFGWLGTIVLMGLLCYAVTRLSYAAARARGVRAHALRLSFVLATTFPLLSLLRDPVVIAVYKNLLQNSLVWPGLLTLVLGMPLFGRRLRPPACPSPTASD